MRNIRIQGKAKKGFTIIELLIVVIVVGILAAAGIGKYQGFAENARARTCTTNQQTIENGIAMWCTQNTTLSDSGDGMEAFHRDGYVWGWAGTAAPFRGTWNIANTIREGKAFKCPKIMSDVGNAVENYPTGWVGWGCADNPYGFYYNGPGVGGNWNGGGNYWYDPQGATVAHQIIWCRAYGGYYCDRYRPEMRKYIHSTRWGY